MQSGGIKRGVLGGASSGAAKKRVSPAGVQARKHVKIAVEEEKENVSRSADAQQIARDVKGKGKAVAEAEEVDFDALMDGMDWEEDAGWSSSQPNKKEVKVSVAAILCLCSEPRNADLRCSVDDCRFLSASNTRAAWSIASQ